MEEDSGYLLVGHGELDESLGGHRCWPAQRWPTRVWPLVPPDALAM
jgi:hypothetical protein